MIIVSPGQPNTRPAAAGGGPLQDGDIWQNATGVRRRQNGDAPPIDWVLHAPVVIYSNNAPNTATGRPDGTAVQFADIWVDPRTGGQAQWDGTAWVGVDPPAGIVPLGGGADEHLAKAQARPFDSRWVDPADGIAFVHEQRAASNVWLVDHQLRATIVAVTVVDTTRNPQVVMIPDIRYVPNACELRFASAVRGFALIHASKPNPDVIVQ